MPTPYQISEGHFCKAFTQAIVSWNNAEWAAQRILGGFVKGNIGSLVVVHHLKNVALQDALIAISDLMGDPATPASAEVAEHVLHFVEGFDTLRVYRNFYVHSVKALGRDEADADKCAGLIYETEAKKKISWIDQTLTYTELTNFLSWVRALERYGDSVALFVNPDNELSPHRRQALPLSSLEKPTWPEKLKKTRTYPSKLPPPPEASLG